MAQRTEGNGNIFYTICETTFNNLDYNVQGGVRYNFGVYGLGTADNPEGWWSHASNAGLSGSPQDGDDGQYLMFNVNDLSSVTVVDSNGNGWDKSSDINVQVTGGLVPSPHRYLSWPARCYPLPA